MKLLILTIVSLTGMALAQDKPRVFVQGKGSQDVTTSSGRWSSRSTIDSHDESMEVTKDLQKNCAGIVITVNQSNADYTVILNRESKHNRGLLRTNSQLQVANGLGDIIGSDATRTVDNASKDACQLILADWGQRGRVAASDSPTPVLAAAPVAAATASTPADAAQVHTVEAIESRPATASDRSIAPEIRRENENGVAGARADASSAPWSGEVIAEVSSNPPGADIEIDGSFVGSTPSSVGVAPGQHTLRVSTEGYRPWERTLRSSTGNIKVAAVLEPMSVGSVGTSQTHATDSSPVADASSKVSSAVGAAPETALAEPAADSGTRHIEETLIGVSFTGNPSVRHDGVEIYAVQPNGAAHDIDLRVGDVILAIDAHYLFTVDDVRAELLRYKPGTRVLMRYRRNQFISENYLNLR